MTIPEPGTYAALGVALASLGFTFRRRIGESLRHVRQAIKG
jgi:hypothetical protein